MKLVKKTLALFLSVILLLALIPQTIFAAGEAKPVTNDNTMEKTRFYEENPLRIAGNFHLIGFNSVETKAHVNGNILTNTLNYHSNFGTHNVEEVSYFRNLDHSVDGFSSTYADIDSVLVVGNAVTVGTTDNGNAWTLDGGKVNAPYRNTFPDNLWQDTTVQFVDIDSVKQEMILVNQKLRQYETFGADVHFQDMNNAYINISDPGGVNYCNLKASDFGSMVEFEGRKFVKGEKGSLVINVDLAGKSEFAFPGSRIIYTDGTEAPIAEVVVWQDGNIVWNFWDSSDPEGLYRGKLITKSETAGHIIAPQATIDITLNLNGTVIAENIIASSETHRTGLTGPVEPEGDFGNLTVSKTVAGNAADINKKFNFRVTLSDTSINGEYGNMTFENGVSTFALKHGESKTATKLPSGISYTVVEDDYSSEGYITSKENDTGTIASSIESKAKFANKKESAEEEGDLTVSKIVAGNVADINKKFNFRVTLSDTSINGEYGNMTFENGVATFTLKHGESKTATKLPSGISYTVVEDDYSSEGYITSKENDTGTIISDTELKAKFVNKKDIVPPGDNIDNPKTGDEIPLILCSFLLIVLGGLIAVSIVLRKN